jgi:hypothetical protein
MAAFANDTTPMEQGRRRTCYEGIFPSLLTQVSLPKWHNLTAKSRITFPVSRVGPSGLWLRVDLKAGTNVSEEYTADIFISNLTFPVSRPLLDQTFLKEVFRMYVILLKIQPNSC